jgi:hypothetical protein
MFTLSRNLLKLAAAGAFVILSASDSAADEMVQNWDRSDLVRLFSPRLAVSTL